EVGFFHLARFAQLRQLCFQFVGGGLRFDRLLQRLGFRAGFGPRTTPGLVVSSSGRIVTVSARPAATAKAKHSGSAPESDFAARFHDFVDALRDHFPFVVTLYFQLFTVAIHHALTHLLRIEVSPPLAWLI